MPIDIDPQLIDELVQRQMAEQDRSASLPPAAAQPKSDGVGTLAKLIYALGGSADVASTAYGLAKGGVQEKNPLVNWAPTAAQIPLGVGMELGSVYLANKLLGKKHPKLMKGLLMGLGGVHGGLALKNLQTLKSVARDQQAPAPEPSPAQSNPNLVQLPDGSWIDPDYFPGLPGK